MSKLLGFPRHQQSVAGPGRGPAERWEWEQGSVDVSWSGDTGLPVACGLRVPFNLLSTSCLSKKR